MYIYTWYFNKKKVSIKSLPILKEYFIIFGWIGSYVLLYLRLAHAHNL